MKKILKWLTIIVILLVIIGYVLYKSNPVIQEFVDVQIMNMQELTEFEVHGNELHISNVINSQTYDQFVKIIKDNPQINTLVELDIPGSLDDDTMIKLAYYVRELGLNTKLIYSSDINSGGVDLFLSGVKRTMERGAHIGVHSWSDGVNEGKDYPKNAPEHEQNRKYIEDMIGEDDFYWFTIYAAPANGIHEMTEQEILQYGLITQPVISDAPRKDNYSGTFVNKIGKIAFGNTKANTVIINSQGGPTTTFDLDGTYSMFIDEAKIDVNNSFVVNVHQEQTLKPWDFKNKHITFEQAKEYDNKSVQRLGEVIKFFKSEGKTVYVVGISFGAFVVQDSLSIDGNIADKYLIMAGRLDMPKDVWEVFSMGSYVGFEYNNGIPKIIPINNHEAGMGGDDLLESSNMSKLAAGLGYKRYSKLLKKIDMSNVTYVYGKTDQQVGSLNQKELEFLKSKKVKIVSSQKDHGGTINEKIKETVSALF